MKILKKTIAVSLSIILIVLSFATENVQAEIYMGYKDFKQTTGALWWKNTTYYRQKIYRVNSVNTYYTGTLKYLSTSLRWDGAKANTTSQSIAISQGITVSKTTSKSYTGNIGLKIPVKCADFTFGSTYNSTNSKTTTKSDTQTYSATLTKKDKAGYYTWEARINFDKYRLSVYKKDSTGKYNTYVGSGYYCTFKSKNPYYYLAYTKNSVN